MMPDPETAAVAWAKTDAAIAALVADRVATRLPDTFRSPFLRVVSIDGEDLVAESSDVRLALLQWDAYAFKGHKARPDFEAASLVMRTLMSRLVEVRSVAVGEAAIEGFARIGGPRRIDEHTSWARFGIDVVMAIRPT